MKRLKCKHLVDKFVQIMDTSRQEYPLLYLLYTLHRLVRKKSKDREQKSEDNV